MFELDEVGSATVHPELEDLTNVPESVLFANPRGGIMPAPQLLAMLLGFYARAARMRDRRSGATVVGERPQGSMFFDHESGSFVSDAGEEIMASPSVNQVTGLPTSNSALLPNHRALYGRDLAMSMIIPPEPWVAAGIYTDDLPQNVGVSEEDKEWVALCFKPKYKPGPTGRPLAHHRCMVCKNEWEAEMGLPVCLQCGESGADANGTLVVRNVLDGWSDEEVLAVKENSRRLRVLISKLAKLGLFHESPQIDEHSTGELGTTHLKTDPRDGMTLGFQITAKGLAGALAWSEAHPRFMNGHTILEAMGKTMAELAPQWVKKENKKLIPVGEWW